MLLYGWLVAKAKHIHKYGDFYLGKGFDVLHIKIEPLQLMWPETTQKVVRQIVEFIEKSENSQKPLLVHGFSVGGYLYGETLVKIHSDPQTQREVGQRIVGQIFDSPVDFEGVPRGFSQAVTPVPVLQKTLEATLNGYLKMFPKKVMAHYLRSSAYFHANEFGTPSLILNSESDPIGVPDAINVVVDKWRQKGIPVNVKTWKDTPHVSHFLHHPVQYITALNNFLDSIGLNDDHQKKEKIILTG